MSNGSWNGVSFAAWNGVAQTAWNGTAISCVDPYLVNTGFEETAGTPTGWAGSADFDSTLIVLQGSQSCSVSAITSKDAYVTFTGQSDLWGFYAFQMTTLANFPHICLLKTAAGADILQIRALNTGAIRVYDGGGEAGTGATDLAASTTYYMWFHYTKGSGSNGIIVIYLSTTTTRPGSPYITISDLDTTTDCGRLYFAPSDNTAIMTLDYVRASTASIGSTPS
jgi:hypothetical protein